MLKRSKNKKKCLTRRNIEILHGFYIGLEVLPNQFILSRNRFKKSKKILKKSARINYSIVEVLKSGKAIEVYKFRYKGWEERNNKIKKVWLG